LKDAAGQLQRVVAMGALMAETRMNLPRSFLGDVDLAFPPTEIEGALPATGLGWNPASALHMFVDLATLWGFGDFDESLGCSTYYDPNSAWYNGFFGGYAMRSYKPDGTAWGYDTSGQVNFDEFFKVTAVDYNFLTAGAFGCPPEKMCFRVTECQPSKSNGWDIANVTAKAPSGLHNPAKAQYPADPSSYLVFGLPHPGLLADGESFAEIELIGQFYLRQLPARSNGRPVSLAWGAAYYNTVAGKALLEKSMAQMAPKYLPLGGSK
jgi:hypothetical protein